MPHSWIHRATGCLLSLLSRYMQKASSVHSFIWRWHWKLSKFKTNLNVVLSGAETLQWYPLRFLVISRIIMSPSYPKRSNSRFPFDQTISLLWNSVLLFPYRARVMPGVVGPFREGCQHPHLIFLQVREVEELLFLKAFPPPIQLFLQWKAHLDPCVILLKCKHILQDRFLCSSHLHLNYINWRFSSTWWKAAFWDWQFRLESHVWDSDKRK